MHLTCATLVSSRQAHGGFVGKPSKYKRGGHKDKYKDKDTYKDTDTDTDKDKYKVLQRQAHGGFLGKPSKYKHYSVEISQPGGVTGPLIEQTNNEGSAYRVNINLWNSLVALICNRI